MTQEELLIKRLKTICKISDNRELQSLVEALIDYLNDKDKVEAGFKK